MLIDLDKMGVSFAKIIALELLAIIVTILLLNYIQLK